MAIRRLFLMYIFFISMVSYSACKDKDKYYDASFLNKSCQVRAALKTEGFKEIYFKSSDNLRINGLFLSRPDATCNVIICGGWLPGKKEEMATFFALLPTYCNILLFDARGHGKSEGPLFSQVWKYGINEYKDIEGAIFYAHSCNMLPIILCGICSGAFNATHAVLNLEKKGLLSTLNIRGLVFDSGWASVKKMSRTVMIGGSDKRMSLFFRGLFRIKNLNDIKSCLWYRILFSLVKFNINVAHALLLSHFFKPYELQTNLFHKIKSTHVPFIFIHSNNDLYAEFKDVQRLASLVKNKECWWIKDDSYHAWHHIKKTELYQKKVFAFIERVLK